MLSLCLIYSLFFLSCLIFLSNNIFQSWIYIILVYINATLVLQLLGFEFLSLINLLVYVGALAVLFLFVIMLIEIPTTELYSNYRKVSFLGLLLYTLVIIFRLFPNFFSNSSPNILPITLIHTNESISKIAETFYTIYADLLILNSIILTIALIGALVLAHSRN